MNLGHLMMKKTQLTSDPRSTSPIRVAPVPGPNGTRKVPILPSSSSSRVVVTSSETAKSTDNQTELLLQNYTNFKKSGVPVQIMVYDNGAWKYVKKEVFELLKLGFSQGKSMIEAQVEEMIFLFDFHRMIVIEVESAQRNSFAWIDLDGKSFFPKVFIENTNTVTSLDLYKENSGKEDQKIEVDESSGSRQNLSKGKRKIDEILNLTSSNSRSKAPKGQGQSQAPRREIITETEVEVQKPIWPKTLVLQEDSRLYTMVKTLFLSGMSHTGAIITTIHQCIWNSGAMYKARLQSFFNQIELTRTVRRNSNDQVVHAWYGTSSKGIETILAHGFGAQAKAYGPTYGVGVHLSAARSPFHSAMLCQEDEHGEKHLVLCRVIPGSVERIELGSNQAYPSSLDYDTGVDDTTNPKCHIIWYADMNTRILPVCIVSFKLAKPGKINTDILLEKLSKVLPLQKIEELQTLNRVFKDGRITRQFFVQNLRTIAGDTVLQELCAEIFSSG